FFDLGGHSLKATKVVSRISRELEADVALKDIFSYPTIESLSDLIKKSSRREYRQIEPVPNQDNYELSNAQKRLWVLAQFEENSIAYNMPGAVILKGEFKEDAFREAYSFIISRHESLRTVFIEENGEPRQKILDKSCFNIEVFDLREAEDINKSSELIVRRNFSESFDLSNGPLVRLEVLRTGDDEYLLLFNMHHIISDGWSRNIFTREFLDAYNGYRKGTSPALTPLRIQYKDYSAWQNSQL
ncbi:MAG: hypothetical protein GY749_15880, partial [Desulfobacteraceae bacterium]|nr:hypothetical protein [Desulfobacteraceae bacterium]